MTNKEEYMKNISRQRRWQINKSKQGLCTICGKRSIVTSNRCEVCVIKYRVYQREFHRRYNNSKRRYMNANSYQGG
jgi:hypothetical protein